MENENLKHGQAEIEMPLGNQFIRFLPLKMWSKGGETRRLLIIWFCLSLLVIPMGMLTRLFEWTGVAVDLGPQTIYLTLYLPMIFCVPLVLWLGFWWAAIPAYLSTFLVALIGGMPIEWIAVFSFANPIALAMYFMFYRITPMRTDLRGAESLVSFLLISLVASLAGSIGAFIWALTNNVGLNEAHPVWLGWWLGGWLQAVLIVGPILYFIGPWVGPKLLRIKDSALHIKSAKGAMLAMVTSFLVVVVCFVGAGRIVSLKQLNNIDWAGGQSMSFAQAQNTVDSLSYPLFILLAVMLAICYLGYRAILYWYDMITTANKKLEESNKQLVRLVSEDSLSGLFNRRHIFEKLNYEYQRSKREESSFSIIMIDADKFKQVNDHYGHLVGDEVIKAIAGCIKSMMRPYDTAGRYGGEEFIAILPSTSCEQAKSIAERLRQSVADLKLATDDSSNILKVTVSIGVATFDEEDLTPQRVIDKADKALLMAKDTGRNKVVAW